MADNIEQYTEWNGIDGVCEVIFEDALDGTWTLDGNTICIDKIGGFEEEACDLLYFEECQCNLHRCNWSPQPTPSDPDAGVCGEGSQDPGQGGGGRVQGVEHYKIKTVSTRFQDEQIHNFIYSNSSVNPEEKCHTFSAQENGTIHLIGEDQSGGSCTMILTPVGPDF